MAGGLESNDSGLDDASLLREGLVAHPQFHRLPEDERRIIMKDSSGENPVPSRFLHAARHSGSDYAKRILNDPFANMAEAVAMLSDEMGIELPYEILAAFRRHPDLPPEYETEFAGMPDQVYLTAVRDEHGLVESCAYYGPHPKIPEYHGKPVVLDFHRTGWRDNAPVYQRNDSHVIKFLGVEQPISTALLPKEKPERSNALNSLEFLLG